MFDGCLNMEYFSTLLYMTSRPRRDAPADTRSPAPRKNMRFAHRTAVNQADHMLLEDDTGGRTEKDDIT